MKKSTRALIFLILLIIDIAYADMSNNVHNADLEARKARVFADAKRLGATNLVYNADLGLWVGLSPNISETEVTVAERQFRRKMEHALPYIGEPIPDYYRLRTLGQLVKISDCIVVGKIDFVEVATATRLLSMFFTSANDITISVDIESVLFGRISRRRIEIGTQWPDEGFRENRIKSGSQNVWNIKRPPRHGDHVLMFLAEDPRWDYGESERTFNFRKETTLESNIYQFTRGNDSIRYLDTPENTTNYLNAVKGYLRELRDEKRDANSYYSFLADLVQSPIQSIREDARSDLMYLVESCPSLDKQRILSDDRIDEAIKYWIDPIFLKAKDEQQKEK